MLEQIGRIGIFMIAAQAMVHFAPGKQYERYIKSVAGIIILVLFLKPFLQLCNIPVEAPSTVLERFEGLVDMPDMMPEETKNLTDAELVRQMEEEVKNLLNRNMEGDDYCVSGVTIRFMTNPELEQSGFWPVVQVCLAERVEEKEKKEGRIGIDKIVIGREQEPSSPVNFSIYREQFAELLGIEKERVEVRQDERW